MIAAIIHGGSHNGSTENAVIDFYWQDWKGYKVVLLFLDLTDPVAACNFKLVLIVMTT